jgi:hypothetical protein
MKIPRRTILSRTDQPERQEERRIDALARKITIAPQQNLRVSPYREECFTLFWRR